MSRMKLKGRSGQEQPIEFQKPARTWQHGEVLDLPIRQIEPNPWNPNEMSPADFDILSDNVDEVGFLDPVLVVPLPVEAGEEQRFRIIDGEHRYEQQRLMDAQVIKCIIADPARFDEKEQKRQTVRMNKIRGKLNLKKFAALANEMMEKHEVGYQDLAREFGFSDEDEFEHMLEAARESLPNAEAKKEFDKAKGELRTVEDLSLLLNRLFTKYGDSLPWNFMILDFGGKEHLWVRLEAKAFKTIRHLARQCQDLGVTFDSVVMRSLVLMDIPDFVSKHRDFLEEPKDQTDVREFLDGGSDE